MAEASRPLMARKNYEHQRNTTQKRAEIPQKKKINEKEKMKKWTTSIIKLKELHQWRRSSKRNKRDAR